MTLRATSAVAVPFTHTAAVGPLADYDLLPADTLGVPTPCNVATGTYRMNLAPSASDFLRASQAAINAAMLAEGSTNTVAFTLSSAGIVTITFAAALSSSVTFADGVWQRLGLASNSIALDANFAIVGTRPVWHLALLTTVKHGHLQPHQAGGSERTTGGRAYTIAASATSYSLPCKVRYQPSSPTYRVSLSSEATAMQPALAYLGALGQTGTAREWSVLDVLQVARNVTCAVALDNWQAIRTSTSESYYLADLDAVLSPQIDSPDERWGAFAECPLSLVMPTTGQTGTRA